MRQMRQHEGRKTGKPTSRTPRVKPHMTHEERQALVYSTKKWRTLRKMVKDAGFRRCVQCGFDAHLLDHIIPIQVSPAAAFGIWNVQPLCRRCHDNKTKRIDAPNGDPAAYRHDLAHEADMRTEALRRWASTMVKSGCALKVIGEPAIGSPPLNKLKDWIPSC